MSLGKLLAAGKTIATGQGSVPYRKNKSVYLPKFGSAKNPFVAPAKEAATGSAPPAAKPVASVAAQPLAKTQKMPTIFPRPVRAASWAEKLNPFRGSPAAPENETRAVQEELSLDSVKVVHNDLSDADVEMVPIKSRPAAGEMPVMPPAGKLLGHLGERILKMS